VKLIDSASVAATVGDWVAASLPSVLIHIEHERLELAPGWTRVEFTPPEPDQVGLEFYIGDDGVVQLDLLDSEHGSFRVESEVDAVRCICDQLAMYARTGVVRVVKRPGWGLLSNRTVGSPEEAAVAALMGARSAVTQLAAPWRAPLRK